MTEVEFIKKRQSDWNLFNSQLHYLHSNKKKFLDLTNYAKNYRRICQDYNICLSNNYSHATLEMLNALVWSGHQELYKNKQKAKASFLEILFIQFPRQVRSQIKIFCIINLLCYGFALFSFLYVLSNENGAQLILGEDQVTDLKSMYDSSSTIFLKPRQTSSSADMFGFYIFNNIGIGFRTFASGIIAGIGSAFFSIFNGIMFGAASGLMVNLGYNNTFFPFIITHSSFELTAITLFGMEGLFLGWTLLVPGRLKRKDAMALAGKKCLPVIYGATLFLFIAAIIEAFWSPFPLPIHIKYISGSLTWLFVILFLMFGGRNHE